MDTNSMLNDQSSAVPTMMANNNNSTVATLVDSLIYKPDELVLLPSGINSNQNRKCLHHNLLNFGGRKIVEIGQQGIITHQAPSTSTSTTSISTDDITQTSLLSAALATQNAAVASLLDMQNMNRPQQARYMRVGPSNAVKADPNSNKMILTNQPSTSVAIAAVPAGVSQTNTNTNVNATNSNNNSDTVSKGYGGLLAKRYLILDLYDGNNLHRCFDVRSREEFVCMSVNNPCSNLLTAHYRLDGHPHINPLKKVIQASKQTYLLLPPSQGDLHSYVRVRRRLKEPEARRLFSQMCETVKACHEQGIVLRDLKLRKFIFADAEKTQLRLESLEDAVVLDNPEQDLLQDKRGCPAYVSPEILQVKGTYSGKAADMWSLGVILYTMLVGKYPFNDSKNASLFTNISRGQLVVPDCLSSSARCLIRSILRRDPEERITSEDILYHPWLLKDDSKNVSRMIGDQCVPDMFMDDEEF